MKHYINIAVVTGILAIGMLLHIFLPDSEVSKPERRKLSAMPELTAENIFSEEFSVKIEEYIADHFPLRDELRTVKALTKFYPLLQADNNDIFIVGDGVYKIEYPLDESQLAYGAKKINTLYKSHMGGCNVYYSIIPDKNYFTAAQNGYPALDYDRLVEFMRENIDTDIEYIDIFDCLEEEDYYRTDTHWRQEKLREVRDRLAEGLGIQGMLPDFDGYTRKEMYPFYGVYYGQSALPFGADTLTYLTNEILENLKVWNIEVEEGHGIYTTEKFEGMDGYDVFLNGAAALQKIENPNAKTDKRLIIFRDSFGSSITPLLAEAYSEITLVDLRYINSRFLSSYVDFENSDVLFLYSTLILNSAKLFK